MTTEGGDEDLARQLQPHLNPSPRPHPPPIHNSDITVTLGPDSSDNSQINANARNPAWETFDDDDITPSSGKTDEVTRTIQTQDSQQMSLVSVPPSVNGGTPDSKNGSAVAMPPHPPANSAPPPVVYSHSSGQVIVMPGGGVGMPGAVIQTSHIQGSSGVHGMDRPLRPKRIRMLKIFSVIAAILFFPTGIPALYYALQIQPQFTEGLTQGNIDRALRSARYCQRLLILSALLLVMVAVLTLAIVERAAHGPHPNSNYLAPHSVNTRS